MIDPDQAEAALRNIGRTIGHWHATEAMLGRALELSLRLDHPVYDFLSVALAERNALHCVTADIRFIRKIKETEHPERVIHLADWHP